MSLVRRLAAATAATTLALVAIGGVVRATGSGDACPRWPGCFPGRFLPPLEAKPLIEFSHRLTAGLLVVLVVATAWAAWRRARRDPGVLWPIAGAIGVVLLQSALGAVRIVEGPKAAIVTLHFAVAMALVALVMMTATAARISRRRPADADPTEPSLRRLTWWTLGVTALLLGVGAYVRGKNAGLVFLDWPLMDGTFIPELTGGATASAFLHRALAAVAVGLGATLAWRARRAAHPAIRALAWTSFGLLVVQAGLGAAAVLTRLAEPAQAGHVAGSSLAWAALMALATAQARLRPSRAADEPEPPRRGIRQTVAAYVQLTKPDIIVLLLVTTVPAMVLAAGGMPPWSLVLATLLGGTLAAGGAGAVNGYLDRDIDEVMARTRRRPIPTHRVPPSNALVFGITLVVVGFVWLWTAVNPLAAGLTASAAAFYVFVYTMWMKRSTPQNIVIGGAAGAVPALVGWAAVTGTVGAPALVLFAIVFAWTPPHFWALALRYRNEYAAARVPMLPVLRGHRETAAHILLYSVLVVATTLLLFPVARMGPIYLGSALVLGGLLISAAIRVLRDTGTRAAMGLFRFSITYLGLLFAAVAVDQLVRT
jgi:protoheme IX farnesyltransferase